MSLLAYAKPPPKLPKISNLWPGAKVAWWDILHHTAVPQADATSLVILISLIALAVVVLMKVTKTFRRIA